MLHPQVGLEMKQPGKSFSISRFMRRMVIATLVIAAIELPLVYFYFASPDHEEKTMQQHPAGTPTVEQPSPGKKVAASPVPEQVELPAEKKALQADTVALAKEKQPAPVVSVENSPAVKKISIILSEEKMEDITTQLSLKSPGKCVKLRQSASSNVANAFDLANFLRKRGYSIAGRETVSRSVKGIVIEEQAQCISVTVGTL